MITKLDDSSRVIAIPNEMRPHYRRVIDYATTALEEKYGVKRGAPSSLAPDQAEDLRLLDDLRMAIHEDY